MMDGPGPPVTSRVAVRPVPWSVAWMRSGSGSIATTLDTQRILFSTVSERRRVQRVGPQNRDDVPRSPMTYSMGCVAGWNPPRAQDGRVRGVIDTGQAPAAEAWLEVAMGAGSWAGGFPGLDG